MWPKMAIDHDLNIIYDLYYDYKSKFSWVMTQYLCFLSIVTFVTIDRNFLGSVSSRIKHYHYAKMNHLMQPMLCSLEINFKSIMDYVEEKMKKSKYCQFIYPIII